MAAPTLCYEVSYPQRKVIRPSYILFKLALAILTIVSLSLTLANDVHDGVRVDAPFTPLS